MKELNNILKAGILILLAIILLALVESIEVDASECNTTTAIPIVIDTDFASDADDVVGIEYAMELADEGLLNIIGIAASTTYSRTPMAIHNLLSQGGYGYVPVAMDTVNGVKVHTDYIDAIYQGGSSCYEQPVQMYRRLLAESEQKVSIVVLGFQQNIEDLLKSGADQYSMLSGIELVAEKVDTIYIVGGNLSNKPSFNLYWGEGRNTTDSAQYVNANCPCRIVYYTEEMGNDVFCGAFYMQQDRGQKDIITRALVANNQQYGVVAWDVFVFFCVVQDEFNALEYYDLSVKNGISYISDTGAFVWTDTNEIYTGRQMFVKSQYGGNYNAYLNGALYQKFNKRQKINTP